MRRWPIPPGGRIPAVIWMCLAMTAGFIAGCGGKDDSATSRRQNVAGMKKTIVEEGDRVLVRYTGTLEDGSVFDQSPEDQPLEFVAGGGQLIAGFDRAVLGMKIGEKKSVTLTPEEGYGPRDEEKVALLSRDQLPAAYNAEEGMGIRLQDRQGRPVPGTIVWVGDDSLRVDLNHPLAGKNLTFEIEVVSIWAGEPSAE